LRINSPEPAWIIGSWEIDAYTSISDSEIDDGETGPKMKGRGQATDCGEIRKQEVGDGIRGGGGGTNA
jgi:hypothetical protein